jgi:hypothetical protein
MSAHTAVVVFCNGPEYFPPPHISSLFWPNHPGASNLEAGLSRDRPAYPPEDLATDEDFWYYIQQSFTVSTGP